MRIIVTLSTLLMLYNAVGGQAVEKGWKGILPISSNKTDVEKVYGKPESVDDNGYHNYRVGDFFVQVDYSTDPCKPNQHNRGKLNIPSNTVLSLWVSVGKTLLLADLEFDRTKYFRDTSGDVLNIANYYSKEMGIVISTAILDAKGNEYVGKITFRPKETSVLKFVCNQL